MKKSFIILQNLYTLWKYRAQVMRCLEEGAKHTGEDQGLFTQNAGDDEVYDGLNIAYRLGIILSMSPKEMRSDFKKISQVIERYDLTNKFDK